MWLIKFNHISLSNMFVVQLVVFPTPLGIGKLLLSDVAPSENIYWMRFSRTIVPFVVLASKHEMRVYIIWSLILFTDYLQTCNSNRLHAGVQHL